MAVESVESELTFVQRCVREGRLLWTYHVNMRLEQRGVDRCTVTESVDTYEIIERYEESKTSRHLPSCLVRAEYAGAIVHVLFAMDRVDSNVRVITAYRPDPLQWEAGFTRRKRS